MIRPEMFEHDNPITADMFRNLRIKVSLLEDAKTDPQSINTIIALIAALAERKLPKNIRIEQPNFDAATVTAVLQAG